MKSKESFGRIKLAFLKNYASKQFNTKYMRIYFFFFFERMMVKESFLFFLFYFQYQFGA